MTRVPAFQPIFLPSLVFAIPTFLVRYHLYALLKHMDYQAALKDQHARPCPVSIIPNSILSTYDLRRLMTNIAYRQLESCAVANECFAIFFADQYQVPTLWNSTLL